LAGKAGQRLRQAATPDDHTAGNAKREFELAELVGRIGNFYTKKGLSPPFALRDDAREWRSLSQDEIVALINKHFDDCRRFYTSGSRDAHFGMVRSAMSKALEAKYPSRDRADDEPMPRLKRRRRGGVRPVPHAGGVDVFDDRDVGGTGQEDDEADA